MTERDEQFHDFVLARRAGLVRTATLLTAGDKHLAEDLVQQTLTKLYVGWPAFRRADNPDGYVRRALVNALTDERRRIWRRRERSMAEPPDVPFQAGSVEAEGAERLRKALKELPPRMRAAVVLPLPGGATADDSEIAAAAAATANSEPPAAWIVRLRRRAPRPRARSAFT